ncbi:MAG TPA: YdbH domain-containing protein, partial [Arenicellales bacterium]|nr:YdbH domain-containing protein [Arenicellales bacterium]
AALDTDTAYRLQRSGRQWSGSGEARFSLSPNPETTLNGRDPAWSWEGETLDFALASARLAPLGLRADSARANAAMTATDGFSGQISAAGLRIEPWPGELRHYDVNGTWSWRDGVLEAAGGGSGSGLPALNWQLETAAASGSIDIRVDDSASAIQSSLARYAAVVAPDLEVLAGRLQGRYQARWQDDRQTTEISMEAGAVDATLGGMEIRGLDVEVNNLDNGVERFGVVLSAPTLKLAAGTVAEDLDVALRWLPPALHIDRAGTRLFSGEIGVRPFHFDTNDESVVIHAQVDGLSLERVMALMELETTELTGQVAGPVRIVYHRDRGVEINRGELHSVDAGTLRFRMSGDSRMEAEVDNIALRALADFRYDELSASVLYMPDGEYRISARILGSNPEVLDGHPIAFNPTIEGRLPALFRAFFFTGDFNQAIIQRLQQERGTSTPDGDSPFEGQ